MLDKGQIKDWDGEPEKAEPAAPVAPPAKDPAAGNVAQAIFAPREAIPTGEFVTLTPEEKQARKRRGQWLALALFAFVILVFVLTMAKVGGGAGVPEVYNMQGS